MAFREQRESDVKQHLEVLDVKASIFHSLDKPGRRLLFYKRGRSVLFWERLFSSLLQHGWDVWMLQEQEVSFLLS